MAPCWSTLGAIYVAALLLSFGGQFAQTIVTAWVGQRVMSDLRRQLFDHLQHLSVPFFDRQPVGRLVTRLTSDVETLNELFSSGVVTVIGDLATLIAISALMLAANWRLALAAFVTLPAMGLVVMLFRRSVRTAFSDIRPRWRASTASCRSNFPASASCSCSIAKPPVRRRSVRSTASTSMRCCGPSRSTRCSSPWWSS